MTSAYHALVTNKVLKLIYNNFRIYLKKNKNTEDLHVLFLYLHPSLSEPILLVNVCSLISNAAEIHLKQTNKQTNTKQTNNSIPTGRIKTVL